ncbi:MAG: TonB-dependent receptor, partial [Pseudomonadota bacterium]
LATATRYPTVGELFQGSLNGDGTFNPDSFDPNLKPERSHDANLLIGHDFGRFKLTGSAFYQRVRNTIFSFTGINQNGVLTSNFKNIDLTRQYGVELIGEARDWPVEGLDIDLNGAWIDSKTLRNPSNTLAEGVQFPRIPRWRINGTIRYALSDAVQASLGMRYASRPNTDLFGRAVFGTLTDGAVNCTSQVTGGVTGYVWQLIDQPSGSMLALGTFSTSASGSFGTPLVRGSYLVALTVT